MKTAKQLAKIEAEIREAVAFQNLPPCQRGERCEWATHTGVNITCSRLIAGCVKLEEAARA